MHSDTMNNSMKLSIRSYFLATIILIFAVFSARGTLQKMRSSERQTDLILISLNDMNNHQEKIFTHLEIKFDSLNTELQKDSLAFIVSPLDDTHKPIRFATVINFRSYQMMMETRNHYFYELISSFESLNKPGTSPVPIDKEILDQILKYQEKADSIKNEYNQSARHHNSYIKGFPRNFYSSLFHFQSKAYIQP